MLAAARIRGPYVVVGHSMGAYNARLFASRRLGEIAGIVLVDPSFENQLDIFEPALPDIAEGVRKSVAYATACADPQRTPETAENCRRAAPAEFPPDLAARFDETTGLDASQTFASEVQSFISVNSGQVIAERRSFGSIPLIVLTRSELSTNMRRESAELELKLWSEMHDQIVQLSTNGSTRVVEGAGHYIHVDRPEAVIDAISEIVDAARNAKSKN